MHSHEDYALGDLCRLRIHLMGGCHYGTISTLFPGLLAGEFRDWTPQELEGFHRGLHATAESRDTRYPRHNLAWHQAQAEASTRRLWREASAAAGVRYPPPPDAGIIQQVCEAVRAAWDDGGRDTWAGLDAEDQEARDASHRAGYPVP
jgi:hypothetical protein